MTVGSPDTAFALRSRRAVIDGREQPATVVVESGKITRIMDYDTPAGCPVQELGNKVLLPGLVDTHVHINEPGRNEWEGFGTATQAAAAGGITTVVDMPLNCTPVTTTAAALDEKLDATRGQLWVDCGFWGGVVPDNFDDLEQLLNAGVLGVKSFTIDSGIEDFPPVDPSHIRRAIPVISAHRVPYLVHAELDSTNTPLTETGNSYRHFLESRPRRWENEAVDLIIALAGEAGRNGHMVRMHIVHLSSMEAIASIERARARGLLITAETCPHYLTLYAEICPDNQPLYKCCPPIRENENRLALWQAVATGAIDFIVSDHSPCTPQMKHLASGDLGKAWGGISSLQFGLSLIWTEARNRGFTLAQIADLMATRPACFAGLKGTKGLIARGYDADLVVFDDTFEFTICQDLIKSRQKFTPYEGRRVTGRVERTLLRGSTVFANGEILGCASGRPILR